jgi:hypothetical protein
MMTSLMTVGLALWLGQVPAQAKPQVPEPLVSMAEKLSLSILRAHYARVGVIPRFLQREEDKETWTGSMGPQAEWLTGAFTNALASEAQGRFEVVDNPTMARIFRDLKLTPAELADRAVLNKIAQQTGAPEALIVGRAVDVRDPARPGATLGRLVESDLVCNLIELRSGALVGSAHRALTISPSLAAYRGEPPDTGTYHPLGAKSLDRTATDKGANTPRLGPTQGEPASQAQAGTVTVLAPSPGPVEPPSLDDPDCPFPVQIVVDGSPRKFIPVKNPATRRVELYVNLEPGESYEIATRNKSEEPVLGAIFVDGVNIFGKQRDGDNPRYWHIAPGQDCRFRGWYSGTVTAEQQEEPFIVRPAADSLAMQLEGAQDRFAERIGEIQFIFFGAEGPQAGGAKSLMPSLFGTGAGEARQIKVQWIEAPKRSDNRLITYVIHYAPMSRIEKRQAVKN